MRTTDHPNRLRRIGMFTAIAALLLGGLAYATPTWLKMPVTAENAREAKVKVTTSTSGQPKLKASASEEDSNKSETTTSALASPFGKPNPGSATGTVTSRPQATPISTSNPGNRFTLLAWNDLGMHCVDGKDYSIMSILPPYNNLHAQLIDRQSGKQVNANVTLTYEAMRDPSGSINTTSSAKTNFWQYVKALYGGAPALDHGLNLNDPAVSNPTPGSQPAPMSFNKTWRWFEAEGLPILPYDDTLTASGYRKNYYPMVRVVARDAKGNTLASTQTVLPVSDEMTCVACHASNANKDAAKPPLQGWSNFTADSEKDWKKNVLRLHDDKHANDPLYQAALLKLQPAATNGLALRAEQGTPTLCAACHGSNALAAPGMSVTLNGATQTISAFTAAMHSRHGKVNDPLKQVALDAVGNRDACYLCHPGSVTKCLRGAMSDTANLDCQGCHGGMAAVGNPKRVGWLQQPNCQSCHHDGKRETTAVTDVATGTLRAVSDRRFATNPDKPKAGFSLFRFSTGHGGNQCETCHGSTHAEYSAKNQTWTSSHDNDLLQSKAVQGYAGTITECSVCHSTIPLTRDGGPHGLHTIGQAWVNAHGDQVGSRGASACTACHGADYRGTALSQVKVAKSFTHDGKQYKLAAGTQVGCYTCHNGPRGD
ncbi:MAG: hypothetical protein WC100_11175 [Sterolibacterium sp.]